ncbi:MAG: selenium metabolism-associated LysR family transcriptional regulator [Synergistaceae bacterium]
MRIRRMEAFVNVVKYKSFSKAANSLFISQPSISAYISDLENDLGVKLIIRSTKEVTLTRAGEKFYFCASEILKKMENIHDEFNRSQNDVSGTLFIAASTVPSEYLIPSIFSEMYRDYPNLKFKVMQSDSKETIRHIENMDADIGIVGSVEDCAHCFFEPFFNDNLVLVTPRNEKYIALDNNIDLENLFREKFILREEGSGTLKETEKFFAKHNLKIKNLNVICELGSTESVLQLVAKGLGVSIVSKVAALDYEKLGYVKIFDLRDELLNRKFYITYHRGNPLLPAVELFIKTAHELQTKMLLEIDK